MINLNVSLVGGRRRYFSLDIVRGLAAFSVLLTHWGLWTITYADTWSATIIRHFDTVLNIVWKGGGIHPGVITFIVLSGFCIHLPQAKNPNHLDKMGFWKNYALRRALRIMPVFWVALLIGLISVWLTGNGAKIIIMWENLILSTVGVGEIARFFAADVASFYPGNGPLSTVGVEMLLYASYPFFMFVNKRFGISALLALGLVGYLAITMARFIGVPPDFIHGTYFEFMLYWIIGAVCASTNVEIKPNGLNWIKGVSVGLIFFYFLLINYVKIKGMHVVTTLLFALTEGLLLIIMLHTEQKLKSSAIKISNFIALIGERSYSLYVIHTPVIFISIYILNVAMPGGANSWIIIMLVLGATELLYRLVERPAHSRSRALSIS